MARPVVLSIRIDGVCRIRPEGKLCCTEIYDAMARDSKLGLIWGFLSTRKKWWLTPIVVTLILLGLLIVLSESSAVAPFIYALF